MFKYSKFKRIKIFDYYLKDIINNNNINISNEYMPFYENIGILYIIMCKY